MLYTVPHYWKQFRCIAGNCPDTCCAGWSIGIDPISMKRYKHTKGPLGNRLKNSVDWREKTFLQYKKRCSFLNEENLCDLYLEGGERMLCKTCRQYPRHTEEYEGVREISLSLSCPEAARLILGCREPVRFLSRETQQEESYEEFDFFLFTKLEDAREKILSVMQDRNRDVFFRMAIVLAMGYKIQMCISKDQLFMLDEDFASFLKGDSIDRFYKKWQSMMPGSRQWFKLARTFTECLDRLEVLKEDWNVYREERKQLLFGEGDQMFQETWKAFLGDRMKSKESREQWGRWQEQLMVYFLFTYFCGSVYDGKAFSKIKLACYSTIIIDLFACSFWKENGGKMEEEDFRQIAVRYSREVEHSDLNLNALDDLFWRNKNFYLRPLLEFLAFFAGGKM